MTLDSSVQLDDIEEELRQVKGAFAFLYGRIILANQQMMAESMAEDGLAYEPSDICGLAETVENGLRRLTEIVHGKIEA